MKTAIAWIIANVEGITTLIVVAAFEVLLFTSSAEIDNKPLAAIMGPILDRTGAMGMRILEKMTQPTKYATMIIPRWKARGLMLAGVVVVSPMDARSS